MCDMLIALHSLHWQFLISAQSGEGAICFLVFCLLKSSLPIDVSLAVICLFASSIFSGLISTWIIIPYCFDVLDANGSVHCIYNCIFFSSSCSSFISSTGVELVSTKFHTVAGSGVGVGVSEEQDSIIDFNNHWNTSITFNNNNNCQLKFNLCIIYSLFILKYIIYILESGVRTVWWMDMLSQKDYFCLWPLHLCLGEQGDAEWGPIS